MLKKTTREPLLRSPKGLYCYAFNWKDGGFNQVWAQRKGQVRSEVKAKFPSWYHNIDMDSVRRVTESELKDLYSYWD